MNCFGYPRLGKTKCYGLREQRIHLLVPQYSVVGLSVELSLLLCVMLYIVEQEGESFARAGTPHAPDQRVIIMCGCVCGCGCVCVYLAWSSVVGCARLYSLCVLRLIKLRLVVFSLCLRTFSFVSVCVLVSVQIPEPACKRRPSISSCSPFLPLFSTPWSETLVVPPQILHVHADIRDNVVKSATTHYQICVFSILRQP